jgi:hypothetical protein
MKPTRHDYNTAMQILQSAAECGCNLSRVRVHLRTDETGEVVDDAANILDYTAGTWACGERTHYTRQQFSQAVSTARYSISQVPQRPAAQISAPSASLQQQRTHGNRADRQRAERLAGRLGLTDRAGKVYPMA